MIGQMRTSAAAERCCSPSPRSSAAHSKIRAPLRLASRLECSWSPGKRRCLGAAAAIQPPHPEVRTERTVNAASPCPVLQRLLDDGPPRAGVGLAIWRRHSYLDIPSPILVFPPLLESLGLCALPWRDLGCARSNHPKSIDSSHSPNHRRNPYEGDGSSVPLGRTGNRCFPPSPSHPLMRPTQSGMSQSPTGQQK